MRLCVWLSIRAVLIVNDPSHNSALAGGIPSRRRFGSWAATDRPLKFDRRLANGTANIAFASRI